MEIEKLIQTAGYILSKYNGIMNYTKLIKILYLADRKTMEKTGYSITGDSYVSMKDGPVLSGLYNLIKNRFNDRITQYYWNSKFQTDGYNIHLLVPFISNGLLSEFELESLDSIDARFHDESYSKMIDYVHDSKNCPEWKRTQSSLPISEEEILRNLGFSETDIEILEEEKESYRYEEALIESIPDVIRESCNV